MTKIEQAAWLGGVGILVGTLAAILLFSEPACSAEVRVLEPGAPYVEVTRCAARGDMITCTRTLERRPTTRELHFRVPSGCGTVCGRVRRYP